MPAADWASVTAFLPAGGQRTRSGGGVNRGGGGLHHPVTAAPLTVWCDVTNTPMWITALLAFYNRVTTTAATQTSAAVKRPSSKLAEI